MIKNHHSEDKIAILQTKQLKLGMGKTLKKNWNISHLAKAILRMENR
jgi:hypothetical protein